MSLDLNPFDLVLLINLVFLYNCTLVCRSTHRDTCALWCIVEILKTLLPKNFIFRNILCRLHRVKIKFFLYEK